MFSQFYIILWLHRFKNLIKDTAQQVQYTCREETIHALVGIKLVNTIRKEHPELFDKELEDKILEEAQSAFESESKIIDWMINGYKQNELDAEILKEYVKNRINDSLKQIGFKKVFKVDKKILEKTLWMEEEVMGNSMTDFFYKKPVEYSRHDKSFNHEDLF